MDPYDEDEDGPPLLVDVEALPTSLDILASNDLKQISKVPITIVTGILHGSTGEVVRKPASFAKIYTIYRLSGCWQDHVT